MKLMRIMLADPKAEIISALKLLLEQEGISVVAEAIEPKSIMTLLKKVEPDALLLDWDLGNGSTSKLFSVLKEQHPKLMVVALSGRPEVQSAALEAGADAFFSKGDNPRKLLAVLSSLKENI